MIFFSRFPTWRRQTSVLLAVFAFVAIPSVAYLAAITWTLAVVDSGFTSASMFPIDLDGDGDTDLVGIAQTPDDVAWYENDGSESFTKNTIDSNAPGVRDVQVGDVDNDGDIDIVIAQVDSTPDGVYWYDNDGDENFTKRTVSTLADPIYIELVDINEDDELDILASAWSLGDLVYYENLGGTPSTFSTTVIDDNMTSPDDVEAGDIDGDGDIDIIMTHGSTSVQFYENDGSETFTETTFAGILTSTSSFDTDLVDIDGDTDLDMIITNSSNTYLFKSDGADNPTFTRTTIDSANSLNFVATADFDGDGDIDVVGSDQGSPGDVYWFENDGSESFTAAVVDSSTTYSWAIHTGDIDGDGNPDILVGSNNGVEYWDNGTAVASASSSTGGQGQARARRAMYKRWRSGEYVHEDTAPPSLAAVGIFDPEEQERMHAAAAGSGSTIQEDDDDDDDDSQASSDVPKLLVQTGRGTEELARIERLHNRHTRKTQVVAIHEVDPVVEEEEFAYESSQHQRVCERVERRFGLEGSMIERINIRLQKRFGWTCESHT